MTGYKWKPIEDLPDDWQKLASSELAGLFAVWKEHVVTLKDSPAYLEFQARLRREWAIETGIIEGLYDIDRGVTRTLIERGLHASLIAHGDANKPAEEIIPMLKDHEAVVEGLFDFVGQKRELSTSYIKQVHQALTTHQETAEGIDQFGRHTPIPLLRGDWKTRPNNPTRPDGSVHEYCPPEQVASEMDRLIEMHQQHLQAGVPPEVEAAWLHHRFTQIHPFQDGNGRVARALASLVLIREGWFPFVVHRDNRSEYIDCLERADEGNIASLITLFSVIERKAFNQALNLSPNVLLPSNSIEQVISVGIEQLRNKLHGKIAFTPQLRAIAAKLGSIVYNRMTWLSGKLDGQLKTIDSNFKVGLSAVANPDTSIDSWITAIANQLGYRADIQTYRYTVSLTIQAEYQSQLLISLHAATEVTPRLLAGSAFLFQSENESLIPVCSEFFQCTTNEEEALVVHRFEEWLEEVLLSGIEQWRRQL
ncbi:MAG: Fic family protein [Blastocatellia bacterium]